MHENQANLVERFYGLSSTEFLFILIGLCTSYSLFLSISKWLQKRSTRPPGPIGLPVVGYVPFLGLEHHKTLKKMTKKYGDIIGLYMGNKFTVVLNEYSVMKDVLTHVGALDRSPKIFDHIPVGFVSENGDKWIEQRRFSLLATRDLGLGRGHWEDLIMDEVQNFVQFVEKSEGKPLAFHHTLKTSISSNIISLLIGRRLKKDEEEDLIQLSIDFSDVSLVYTSPSLLATVVPGFRKLLEIFKIAGYDRAAKIIRKFNAFVRGEIIKHRTSPESSDTNDFINTYLSKLEKMKNQPNTKHFFSEAMLEGNVNVLFLASSDTIFSSLEWLLRLMADFPNVQKKVHKELMDVLGRDGRARYEEKDKIPFTFSVLMESQRFSSIVPLSTTRVVLHRGKLDGIAQLPTTSTIIFGPRSGNIIPFASQDISIRGFVIPKGTEIFANLWALHNDPNYWKEPEKFLPERFLTEDGTKLIKEPRSYAPFSVGRRNCPGKTIAWMEILAYFSEIVKRFEISAPPGSPSEYEVMNGLVSHLVPHPLCFKERK